MRAILVPDPDGGVTVRLVNLTPHAINICRGDAQITVPPSGIVARVATTKDVIETITVDGVEIPVHKVVFGPVENLPDPVAGTYFLVSAIVAQAVTDRADLVIVDDAVRDAEGRVVGARALAKI
jgi:hypothetical protein